MILDKEIGIFRLDSKDLALVKDEKKDTFDLQLDKKNPSQKKLLLIPLLQEKMKL